MALNDQAAFYLATFTDMLRPSATGGASVLYSTAEIQMLINEQVGGHIDIDDVHNYMQELGYKLTFTREKGFAWVMYETA